MAVMTGGQSMTLGVVFARPRLTIVVPHAPLAVDFLALAFARANGFVAMKTFAGVTILHNNLLDE